MNTGAISVYVAFGSAGATLIAYLLAWSGNAPARKAARALFVVMTAALALASILMMAAILSDDFSIRYITEYSSRDLPLLYKISAFWGGQEGTLLLWALLQAVIGLFVFRRRDDEWEPAVMSFLMIPQIFLLLLLAKSRPFDSVPAPPDGAGLNPLLQDPWMAIHPPIVFLGYAALVAPFAFALAALARKESDAWVPRVMPWVLVSVLTLGLGLFLGGFWAYKVLGWGGYWGWDPVENSSLAPWIVGAALLHGLLTQRATGGLKRTNFILAALAYTLVLYATYMTRSGILANFSVHSFADFGLNNYLIAAIVVAAGVPAVLLAVRWSSIKSPVLEWNVGLPAAMALGMVLLLAATTLLVVGTSWPILSTLYGSPASPGPGFYNRTSLPIGIAIAALLIAAPLMGWVPTTWRDLLRKVAPGLAAGVVIAALPPAFGIWPKGGVLVLILLAFGIAALVASSIRVARQIRHSPMMIGAGISHAGLALMFVGIVTTSAFDHMATVTLTPGQPQKTLGHEFTLKQYVSEGTREPHFEIDVVPEGGQPFVARPIMFRDARRDQTIARPAIHRRLLGDLYLAPVAHRVEEGNGTKTELLKDKAEIWGPFTLTFRRFQSHAQDGGALNVGAIVDVTRDGHTEQATLMLTMGPGGLESPWVPLPMGQGATGRLDGMKVETGTIRVTLQDPSAAGAPETLTADVSTKPLVNALWLGIILVAAGSAIATAQRASEGKVLLRVAQARGPAKAPIRAGGGAVMPIGRKAQRK